MATLDEILEQNTKAAEALAQVVELLNRAQERAPGGDGKGGGGSGKGFYAALGQVAGAATAAAGAVTGLAFAALSFVQSLNPGLASLFNQELQNLYATIGGALEPVIQTAIPIVRQLAAIFLDLSTELKPIIEELSSALGSVFIAVVRLVATELKALFAILQPFIKLAAMQMNLVAQAIEVWGAFLKAIIDTVSEFISATGIVGDVNDALKEFGGWVNRVAGVIAQFAGRMLILLGLTDLLDKFRANIKGAIDSKLAPKGGLLAAPQGAATGSIEGIATKFAEKAFAASAGGATKKPEVGLLEEILKGLTAARTEGKKELKDIIIEAIKFAFGLDGAKVEKVMEIFDESVSTVKSVAKSPLARGALKLAAPPVGLAVDIAEGVSNWPF